MTSTPTSSEAWLAEEEDIVPLLITRLQESSLESLGKQLDAALPYLEQHFRAEEEPDGLFDSLRQLAPRTDAKLRDLAAEHGMLLDAARSLQATLEACLRGRAELVAGLRRHNRLETDLLHEVYLLDLGRGS